jgi:hypothetical protein
MQLFAIPYSVSQAVRALGPGAPRRRAHAPAPQFARATHTSPRLYFFIFALLQCLIQVVLRASVLAMDVQAVAITDLLLARLPAADAGSRSHVPVMQDGALLGCDRPPLQTGVVCAVVSHAPTGPMVRAHAGSRGPLLICLAARRGACAQYPGRGHPPADVHGPVSALDDPAEHRVSGHDVRSRRLLMLCACSFMDGEKEDSTLLLFQVFLLALGMSGVRWPTPLRSPS